MATLTIVAWVEGGRQRVLRAPDAVITSENQDCVDCHQVKSPGIVGQWEISTHAQSGIGCMQCHQAELGDIDGYKHEGSFIATIVSPKDCARCHEPETAQFEASHHADAGKILGSLDNVLAEVVEGFTPFDSQGNKLGSSPAAVSGCLQCHGSEIKVLEDGKLDPDTWPNTGIGRINPDGSRGSCSACHLRHNFSRAQARMPENCGRCHLGPDHPQFEVYMESKHGIAFVANRTRFEPMMEEKEWIPGKHFEQGPTCTTCHMSATRNLIPLTHDVGERISWKRVGSPVVRRRSPDFIGSRGRHGWALLDGPLGAMLFSSGTSLGLAGEDLSMFSGVPNGPLRAALLSTPQCIIRVT